MQLAVSGWISAICFFIGGIAMAFCCSVCPVEARHEIKTRRSEPELLWGLVFGILFGFFLRKGGVTESTT